MTEKTFYSNISVEIKDKYKNIERVKKYITMGEYIALSPHDRNFYSEYTGVGVVAVNNV